MGSSSVPGWMFVSILLGWWIVVFRRTFARSIEWAHIEDVHTLHLSENLETLETGGLLEICRNGTGLTTLWQKVALAGDLCSSAVSAHCPCPPSSLSLSLSSPSNGFNSELGSPTFGSALVSPTLLSVLSMFCSAVFGGIEVVHFRAETANDRRTAGWKTARLVSAGATRRRNMVERSEWVVCCWSGLQLSCMH